MQQLHFDHSHVLQDFRDFCAGYSIGFDDDSEHWHCVPLLAPILPYSLSALRVQVTVFHGYRSLGCPGADFSNGFGHGFDAYTALWMAPMNTPADAVQYPGVYPGLMQLLHAYYPTYERSILV